MTDRQTNVTDIIMCPNKIRAHIFINVPVVLHNIYRYSIYNQSHMRIYSSMSNDNFRQGPVTYLSPDVTNELSMKHPITSGAVVLDLWMVMSLLWKPLSIGLTRLRS